MRKCVRCGIEKDIKNYSRYKCRNNLLLTKCKSCCNDYSKKYYKLKKNYKNIHKYCFCCKKYDEKLILDHDHTTNKVRGWLCKKCNVGIGNLGDNIEGLIMGLQYLKQSSKKQFIE